LPLKSTQIIFANMINHIANDMIEGNINFDEGNRFVLLRRSGMKGKDGENFHTLNFTVISSLEETNEWARALDSLKTQDWDTKFIQLGKPEDYQ